LPPRPSSILSLIPEAYQSKTVRYGPNCLPETIANLAATMPKMLTVGMEDEMVAYWIARSKDLEIVIVESI